MEVGRDKLICIVRFISGPHVKYVYFCPQVAHFALCIVQCAFLSGPTSSSLIASEVVHCASSLSLRPELQSAYFASEVVHCA